MSFQSQAADARGLDPAHDQIHEQQGAVYDDHHTISEIKPHTRLFNTSLVFSIYGIINPSL